MQDNVVLRYRRVGEAYVGTVDDVPFEGLEFSDMMLAVNAALVLRPAAGLIIQRTERAGLMPVELAADMLELLRADPLRYIQMHSIPPRTVDLRDKSKRESALVAGERYNMPKTTGLRAGVDTLAAAFGETIYLKMRDKLVEHPATGRWVTFYEIEHYLGTHNAEIISPGERKSGWVTILLKDLLATTTNKFYLPREWNTHGGWITREQLNELYEQFIEEKGALLCQSEPTTAS